MAPAAGTSHPILPTVTPLMALAATEETKERRRVRLPPTASSRWAGTCKLWRRCDRGVITALVQVSTVPKSFQIPLLLRSARRISPPMPLWKHAIRIPRVPSRSLRRRRDRWGLRWRWSCRSLRWHGVRPCAVLRHRLPTALLCCTREPFGRGHCRLRLRRCGCHGLPMLSSYRRQIDAYCACRGGSRRTFISACHRGCLRAASTRGASSFGSFLGLPLRPHLSTGCA